jgi:hypothetical protein
MEILGPQPYTEHAQACRAFLRIRSEPLLRARRQINSKIEIRPFTDFGVPIYQVQAEVHPIVSTVAVVTACGVNRLPMQEDRLFQMAQRARSEVLTVEGLAEQILHVRPRRQCRQDLNGPKELDGLLKRPIFSQ